MDEHRRRQNEKKFGRWILLSDGGRRYQYDVIGRYGWQARYIKIVDRDEKTLQFLQEIYNERGELEEIHEKFPLDTGHKKVRGGE